jgi:hypothetical protein
MPNDECQMKNRVTNCELRVVRNGISHGGAARQSLLKSVGVERDGAGGVAGGA